MSDKHARVSFSIDGYRPNGYSAFGEIDNSVVLDGSFGYNLYESAEWGAGEFSSSLCMPFLKPTLKNGIVKFRNADGTQTPIKSEILSRDAPGLGFFLWSDVWKCRE